MRYSYDRRIAAGMPKEPGLHEFDVKAGPIEVTLQVNIPERSEKSKPNARVVVDGSMVDRDLLEEYEGTVLAAVGRFLGKRVSWGEGDWGRGLHGTLTRSVGL